MLVNFQARERSEPVSEAVFNLRQALVANLNWEVSYLDVKFLIDKEAEYRNHVRAQIRAYRAWQKQAGQQRDVHVIFFNEMGGRLMVRSLADHISFWKTIRSERRFLQDVYVSQIKKSRN